MGIVTTDHEMYDLSAYSQYWRMPGKGKLYIDSPEEDRLAFWMTTKTKGSQVDRTFHTQANVRVEWHELNQLRNWSSAGGRTSWDRIQQHVSRPERQLRSFRRKGAAGAQVAKGAAAAPFGALTQCPGTECGQFHPISVARAAHSIPAGTDSYQTIATSNYSLEELRLADYQQRKHKGAAAGATAGGGFGSPPAKGTVQTWTDHRVSVS